MMYDVKLEKEESVSVSETESEESKTKTETESDKESGATAQVERLGERIEKYLHKLEGDIKKADEAIGDKMRVLDKDRDGLISPKELEDVVQNVLAKYNTEDEAFTVVKQLVKHVAKRRGGRVSVEDLKKLAAKGIPGCTTSTSTEDKENKSKTKEKSTTMSSSAGSSATGSGSESTSHKSQKSAGKATTTGRTTTNKKS